MTPGFNSDVKKKRVRYQRSLVCHLDLLGFKQLVQQKSPGEISRVLRLFSDEVSPKASVPVKELNRKQFVSFSDLHITVIPIGAEAGYSRGLVFLQLLRLVHAQAILFFEHGIVVRGAVVVGDAVRSHGRFFGQGIIDAYEIESRDAVYPRIIVAASVLEELDKNPKLWTHDRDDERKAVKGLLHCDEESGLHYIDYLRV